MKFTILDANMWLLPWPLSVDVKKRLDDLLELIERKNPDFITLQEVWRSKYVRYLENNLSYINNYASSNFINKTGLVTFSKISPEKADKEIFLDPGPKKGYLISTFNFNDMKVVLINTHLYNQNSPEEKEVTAAQLNLLKKKVEDDALNIISGDLNLSTKSFNPINKGFFEFDELKDYTVSEDNKYTHSRYNKYLRKGRSIDYCLLKNNMQKDIKVQTSIIHKPILSDHYAIFSKINVK